MGVNEDKINVYVEKVCSFVKNKEVHSQISLELKDHIEELAEEFIASDIPEDEAVEKAISQMGDAEEIGRKLDKVHKPKPEWSIWIMTLFLSAVGLLAIYFIGKEMTNPDLFSDSLIYNTIGMGIVIGLYLMDYKKIKKFSLIIYLITLIFMILSRLLLPSQIFYSSQCIPFLLVLGIAGIFDRWDMNKPVNLVSGMMMLAVPIILLVNGSNICSMSICYLLGIVILVAAGIKKRYISLYIAAGIIFISFTIGSVPYRIARFLVLFKSDSIQALQLKPLLCSSGLFGNGFLEKSKTTLLPFMHTEFIYCYIVYVFGWIVGITLLTVIAFFIFRIIKVAVKSKDNYGRLLVFGFAAILAAEFCFNILMTFGIIAVTGFEMPFVGYGKTNTIINMCMIGIISSVYRRRNVIQSA